MTLSEQLKSLVEKATPGPWDCTGCLFPDDNWGGVYYRLQAEGMDASGANASLIVTLVNNLPTILAALEAAENTHD